MEKTDTETKDIPLNIIQNIWLQFWISLFRIRVLQYCLNGFLSAETQYPHRAPDNKSKPDGSYLVVLYALTYFQYGFQILITQLACAILNQGLFLYQTFSLMLQKETDAAYAPGQYPLIVFDFIKDSLNSDKAFQQPRIMPKIVKQNIYFFCYALL